MQKLFLLLLLCSGLSSVTHAQMRVVTTIEPLALISQAILGDAGDAMAIVDPRLSPHHYNLAPSDRLALASADLIVWVGPEFEVYLADFFGDPMVRERLLTAVDVPGLTLHEQQGHSIDPHLWLDTGNALDIAGAISARLSAAAPDRGAYFQANLQRFARDVAALESRVATTLVPLEGRHYAVYHAAFRYFERQFGLTHDLVLLRNPELQPSMRELLATRRALQELKPDCVLLDLETNEDLLATMLGGLAPTRITVDLMGSTDTTTYITLLDNVAAAFADCR